MRKGTGFFVAVMLCLVMILPVSLEASVVIEFQQGAATGGEISFTNEGMGAKALIPINTMVVSGAGNKDGTYDLMGPLNSTYAYLQFVTPYRLELWGYIPTLGLGGPKTIYSLVVNKLAGFQDLAIDISTKGFILTGAGGDLKHPELLSALGLEDLSYRDWNFSLTVKGEALMTADGYKVTSAVLTNTYAAPVPIPAAVWLLGSGLIGLIGIRKIRK